MTKLSIRQAATIFNVSRPTLAKRLKNGAISGEQIEGGSWLIDASELIRAGYEPRSTEPIRSTAGKAEPDKLSTIAGGLDGEAEAVLRARLADAERRAAVAEALADERAARIEDLRRLLPDGRSVSWWPWWRKS